MMQLSKICEPSDIDNPMAAYMNEIVFSRVIGHDDIVNGEQWKDTS